VNFKGQKFGFAPPRVTGRSRRQPRKGKRPSLAAVAAQLNAEGHPNRAGRELVASNGASGAAGRLNVSALSGPEFRFSGHPVLLARPRWLNGAD
jgi:hypothetical protein